MVAQPPEAKAATDPTGQAEFTGLSDSLSDRLQKMVDFMEDHPRQRPFVRGIGSLLFVAGLSLIVLALLITPDSYKAMVGLGSVGLGLGLVLAIGGIYLPEPITGDSLANQGVVSVTWPERHRTAEVVSVRALDDVFPSGQHGHKLHHATEHLWAGVWEGSVSERDSADIDWAFHPHCEVTAGTSGCMDTFLGHKYAKNSAYEFAFLFVGEKTHENFAHYLELAALVKDYPAYYDGIADSGFAKISNAERASRQEWTKDAHHVFSLGMRRHPSPSVLLEWFDNAVLSGSLKGVSATEGKTDKAVKEYRQKLVNIQRLDRRGRHSQACAAIDDALKGCDALTSTANHESGDDDLQGLSSRLDQLKSRQQELAFA